MRTDPISSAFGSSEAIDRPTFYALLAGAIKVAKVHSAPVLIMIDIEDLREIGILQGIQKQRVIAQNVAARFAASVGTEGFVCALGGSRLAVLTASDGLQSVEVLEKALLCTLLRLAKDGIAVSPAATISTAKWPVDGETADALFVLADHGIFAARAQCEQEQHRPPREDTNVLVTEQHSGNLARFPASPLRATG